MSAVVVTTKGQVTLRRDLLEQLGVRPGGKVTISKLPNGTIEIKAAQSTGKISDVFGFLKTKQKGKSLSINEMNDVIARGWSGKRR
ncbi:AbrB/MazE/SpoVT family DNA-binding domain-containing protein [Bradyrhizobium sp. AUGA SZCCT0283]|uniref:AbrB/MazE/SpoVT family DNA-binding domain-containing protein n=1 Tax=Bradyrhizobium sp. AUGA SZCCT0283 TaxID=2807671 RepID=UPI001BA99F23|nr:AbrB/MazE/SpoVT family DNA-binding domain-containing protein [Bradyrhizobium sp. AUGA SZCCT0283]MBR1277556.1 AbrB/MazE/SpoVT family DNA-binding domain-containing protein [Bradyrhizobium sp. AUGA SZCCT0283]